METFWQDLRYAIRTLVRSRGFTAVALITLALGIGANTAIFSVLQGVVLKPLPYRDPDRLTLVWLYNLSLKSITSLSYLDFLDWQRNARSFDQMAAFTPHDYDLTNPGAAEHVSGREVTSGFFKTLGVDLFLGREFTPEEDRQGGVPVAVISSRLWRDRFGASTTLGKIITLDGADYTVVGVLPQQFRFGTEPEQADVYTPLGQGNPLNRNNRTAHDIACIARLRSNVGIVQAQVEMNTVQKNLNSLHPNEERGLETKIIPLKEQMLGDVQSTLVLLLGAVGIVLLIACANVANLLFARSAARIREFAIRSALGANRSRIVLQLVTESTLLSVLGGTLGLGVAKLSLNAILAAMPGSLPRSEEIGLSFPVLLFTFLVSIAVGLLFGLAPALKSSFVDIQTSLRGGGRGLTSTHHRAQSSLVVVQMALTLVLLAGAGLLFRTIRNLWQVDPGFNAQHIVTFKVGLSPSLAKNPPSMRVAYEQLINRIRNIPGVQSADITTLVPLSQDDNSLPFWVGGEQPSSIAEAPRVLTYSTGRDYLKVMGIPLLRGRFFTAEDTVNSEPVVVIDAVLAHAYFRDENPVGRSITFASVGPYRIIGVVGHVHHWGLGDTSSYTQNQAYTSFYQIQDRWLPIMSSDSTVVARTVLTPGVLLPAVSATIYGDGNQEPVYHAKTIEQLVSESMSSQRFPMILLGTFAALALILASVGIYGVMSYSVSLRMQEIGIRMALGAEKKTIFQMVVGEGLRLTILGLIIGTVAALILTRVVSSFASLVYGIGTRDPLTLTTVAVLLVGVSLLACYIPASRATKADPMRVLRYE